MSAGYSVRAFLLAISAAFSSSCAAGTPPPDFEQTFYAPVQLSSIVVPRTGLSSLAPQDEARVLAARNALIGFFKSLQDPKGDPLVYLAADLRKQFSSRAELGRQVFSAEAYLAIEPLGFRIDPKGENVTLRVGLKETTEGTDCTMQRQYTLRSINGEWKIQSLD